jgi:hypothetical protein
MSGFRKISLVSVILSGVVFSTFAQTKDSYDYNSEFTWGINKNTSGGLIGGFTFKKARKINEKMLQTYGLEIMNVKHPQEVKRNADATGNPFIFGKSNYLYALRLQYGRDLILFKKAPQQGVEIKLVTSIGPSIGIVAPYYIERKVDDNNLYVTVNEQYNPNNPHHTYDNILGTGNLFQGIGESKIQLGANAKVGANFELGSSKGQVSGFEVGFLVDAYMQKVILMPTTYNKAIFPTLYFTLFYGSRK